MMYRCEMMSVSGGKNLNLSKEDVRDSGFVVPQALAMITFRRMNEDLSTDSGLVLPTLADTIMASATRMDYTPTIALPEDSTTHDDVTDMLNAAVARGKSIVEIDGLNQIAVFAQTDHTDDEQDAFDQLRRSLHELVADPDERPMPGFYL